MSFRPASDRPRRAFRFGLVRAAASVAATVAASHARGAAAAEVLLGPQIRNGGYLASSAPGPEGADRDDFRAPLVRGERLDVTLTTPAASGFIGQVEVLGPDGGVRPFEARVSLSGRRLRISGAGIDATGLWTVRVSPRFDTAGKYRIGFRVRPAPDAELVVPPDESGTSPLTGRLAFDALEGSELSLVASPGGGADAPALDTLLDPSGADVPGTSGPAAGEADVRRRTLRLETPLAAGDGSYSASFSAPAGHPGFGARASVRRPPLLRGVKRFGPHEPYIDVRDSPLRGTFGLRARITGLRFSASVPPEVWFGDVRAAEVAVDEFGTRADVMPPELPEGTVVRIGVVNPDGQASERAGYFRYVPTPVFADLTDLDGAPVRGASTDGGRPLLVSGANFETGVLVRFDGSPVAIPQIRAPDLMEIVTPARAAGIVRVRIEDAYLHDVDGGFDFEFKAPPDPSAAVYVPPAALASQWTAIEMSGSGFVNGDVVEVEGAEVQTVWFSATKLRFEAPPGSAGPLRIEVVDRVGTRVRAPDLTRL